jgi:hypothetical protein
MQKKPVHFSHTCRIHSVSIALKAGLKFTDIELYIKIFPVFQNTFSPPILYFLPGLKGQSASWRIARGIVEGGTNRNAAPGR